MTPDQASVAAPGAGSLSRDEVLHQAALVALPDLGPRRLAALQRGRSAADTWADIIASRLEPQPGLINAELAKRWTDHARRFDVAAFAESLQRHHIGIVVPGDPLWPEQLNSDPEPPALLFTQGTLGHVTPCVAIVGTRRCTPYGRRVARQLGAGLAARGIGVVSGLALGIDAEAQRAAFGEGGPVIGVVGSGLDVVYPRANTRLWSDIAATGRLWSEFAPGTRPAKWRFPARNRLVVALADVVVVVESGERGGSLHTVESAIDRGVDVLAVPGPIDSEASVGTNRLLVQGCVPCTGVDDVLVSLGLSCASPAPLAGQPQLGEPAQRLIQLIGSEPTTTGALAAVSGLGIAAMMSALDELIGAGLVRDIGGWIERA